MAQNTGSGKPDAKQVYGVLTSLVIHAEQIRWTRVNSLLVVESIFLAAWVGLFKGTGSFPDKEYLLLLLCVPGIILGILFAYLGWRSSDYLDKYHNLAEEMEEGFPAGLVLPFHGSKTIREESKKPPEKLTTSRCLVTGIPLIFVALFTALGIASCVVKQ